MSTEMQTKVQASPVQSFTPVQTGLLQRTCTLCNTPGLVEDSERDAGKMTLQRSSADQAGTTTMPPIVHRALRSPGQPLDPETRAYMEPRFGHDFSRVSVHSTKPGMIQTKLKINEPGDHYEQEADRVAEQVMRMPEPRAASETKPPQIPHILQYPKCKNRDEVIFQSRDTSDKTPKITPDLQARINGTKSGGSPLPDEVRTFMEPRFGADFGQVHLYTDSGAVQMNRALNAQAFTHRQNIYFGAGKSVGNDALTAHELTHVLQQTGGARSKEDGHVPAVQREVQVRPPGRGEASAFDQRQALIDRMNGLSTGMEYRLDGRVIRYNVIDETALTPFDRQMQGFIDRAEVVPMRLITGAGYVQGAGGAFQPLSLDSFVLGYVDLDDLLASDDLGFQARLIHVLTERFATRDYERRIGTAFTMAEFNPAHRAAHEAEAELFRDVIGDPTIRFLYAEARPNGTWVVAFRSDEGYRIFRVVRGAGREVQGAEVWVRARDGRRLTVDQLRAERAAAAAP